MNLRGSSACESCGHRYDPANGDWEYFYYSLNAFSTGKLANCVDCHRNGKRDHVFNVWDLKSR
jgi:hypothetical protein